MARRVWEAWTTVSGQAGSRIIGPDPLAADPAGVLPTQTLLRTLLWVRLWAPPAIDPLTTMFLAGAGAITMMSKSQMQTVDPDDPLLGPWSQPAGTGAFRWLWWWRPVWMLWLPDGAHNQLQAVPSTDPVSAEVQETWPPLADEPGVPVFWWQSNPTVSWEPTVYASCRFLHTAPD